MTTPARIRIIIIDDHMMVRDSLKIFLLNFNDLEVVADASNGEQGINLCLQLQPDVVLLDMVMPGMNGAATARTLRELCPSTKVLVLTSFPQNPLVQQALQAGAVGCVSKASPPQELVAAIRAAYTNPSL